MRKYDSSAFLFPVHQVITDYIRSALCSDCSLGITGPACNGLLRSFDQTLDVGLDSAPPPGCLLRAAFLDIPQGPSQNHYAGATIFDQPLHSRSG